MKKSIILALLFCACFSLNISAQAPADTNTAVSKPTQEEIKNFMLFKNPRNLSFYKLDTRSGVITELNIDYIKPINERFEEKPYNPVTLVPENEQISGRFTIIMKDKSGERSYYGDYDILLDQISGKVWVLYDLYQSAKE